MLIILFSDMGVTARREKGQAPEYKLTKKETKIENLVIFPMGISWIYAIFLPLQLGTIWLNSGLIIFLFGIIFTITAIHNFATSPIDKVITKGLYHYTRNPAYLGMILMQIGLGIACASWLYLLLTAVLMITLNAVLASEERYLLYRYGNKYQKYKNSTPRWIRIPKTKEKHNRLVES